MKRTDAQRSDRGRLGHGGPLAFRFMREHYTPIALWAIGFLICCWPD